MLSCSEVTRHASDYLDRDLPRLVRWRIRLHLLMCEHCRRFLRQLELTRLAVRDQQRRQAAVNAGDSTSVQEIVDRAISRDPSER